MIIPPILHQKCPNLGSLPIPDHYYIKAAGWNDTEKVFEVLFAPRMSELSALVPKDPSKPF
jgi:hypothetical protein